MIKYIILLGLVFGSLYTGIYGHLKDDPFPWLTIIIRILCILNMVVLLVHTIQEIKMDKRKKRQQLIDDLIS